MDEDEKKEIIEEHYCKTMKTLEFLMTQVNMMYYMDKVRLQHLENELTITDINKLLQRILKMYNMFD